ncbi:hypothetical protein SAMN05192555_101143 [Franzmannia pantelleriensis]|uniref:Uncharacterized protein n=1 Tax=Franzmannia pantelleriensis TaxID=48727 RepID=A0A1G9EKI8_9GAMM|nr:hypothetical protein [Halomonas pantelleriensis]SDK76593.1 hypothetical protein SAMN05192555_101143 [Halomonas pantelleriensis]
MILKGNIHKGWLAIAGSAFLFTIAYGETVQASTSATDYDAAVYQQSRQLDDNELAGLRGRFVDGNKVLFFGVEMSTAWQTPSGESLHASANLQLDFSAKTPKASFTPHITSTSSEALAAANGHQGNGSVITTMDMGSSKGVMQVIQAGGDFNVAGNDFQFDVSTRRPTSQASGGNGQGHLETDAGSMVSITRDANGLGMSMTIPNQGSVNQAIRARQGLHQSVQLTSDHQQVHNLTRMHLQIARDSGGVSNQAVKRMIESTRDLGGL